MTLSLIPDQRHLFDLPDELAYLNCAYMSPLMHRVREAGERGVRRKAQPWRIVPGDFFSESERARELFARLVDASADDIAIVPAASYGVGLAARNLPLDGGQKVLLLADQFPSNVYPWRELARARTATLVTVPRPADDDWTAAVLAAIDPETAIVALPHCHWVDGALLDLPRIGERVRETGAALVVDLTQSLGALPFSVKTVQPDFAVAATYKWLLGPYTLGFCYVAPRWQAGDPLEYNWITRKGSEDFARLVDYRDEYQAGARRFDMGERSNFHLMPMAVAALEQIIEWGVDAIAATLREKNREIAERGRSLGLTALEEKRRAGHYLGLRFPVSPPADLAKRLSERNVHISLRGDALRVTPHLYNNDRDIDRLFDALSESHRLQQC
ncbi:MAG: aminotransferase class V-fold PLP-dependent enzyme [Gammaproteobacteria bacterium]